MSSSASSRETLESGISRRMKREVSKGDQCKAMELGGKVAGTVNDVISDLGDIPIIGDALGVFTAGISVVSHLFSGGLDIAQTAVDCGDIPFDEIKEIMDKRFNEVDRKLDEQTAALRAVTKLVNKTLITVEKTRSEMHERFDEVLESIDITQVDPIISKINNFVQFFNTESDRTKGLKVNEYITKLMENDHNFLRYLSDYRTPQGLLAVLQNLIKQRYAVPDSNHDTSAFKALDALIYGTQTYVAVMFFLIEQYSYLANYHYQISDIDNYNKALDGVINSFKDFRTSLLGRGIAGKDEPLLTRVIELLKEVNSLDFVWAHKARRLTDSIRSFESLKFQIANMTLPVIEEAPKNFVQLSFKKNVKTPIGDWAPGKYVSYAIQYQSNDKYAKVGDWSNPILVQGKACPSLKVPVDQLRRDRLVFRKFKGEMPRLVGVIKAFETDFTDINRDFYDAVDTPDKDFGNREAKILSSEGADINAMFEKGRRALHAAAKWGNSEISTSLLAGKFSSNINVRDKDGFSPLHIAVEAGQDDFMNFLIKRRCSVTVKSFPSLLTPLHLAARSGFSKTLETLLKMSSIEINAQDMSGFTPLHNAIVGGERVVDMLVKSGKADINIQSKTGLTPFHLAVINNDLEVAKSLMKSNKVNINAGDNNNMTPLHHAAMMGHLQMVDYLLSLNGIKINEGTNDNKWSPLHYSIFFRKDDVSKRLLADENLKIRTSANGWLTALHFAVTFGRKDVLLEILKHGILIDQQEQNGFSPLHLAAMRETPDILNVLIKNKANINAKTFKQSTPLHEAALHGRLENVLILLDKEADIAAEDESGNTPIHKAALSGSVSMVDLFLRRDKNLLERKNKMGETPLHVASQKQNSGVIKFLKNKGASVNVKNEAGVTPLQLYSKAGQLDMVQYLIDNGADMYVTDKRRNDFLYYAIQNGHYDIVQYAFGDKKYNYNTLKDSHISMLCSKQCPWVICDANEFDQLDMMKYFFEKLQPKDCVLVNEAAVYGHLAVVKYFIQERKAKYEVESPSAYPPLCSAASEGHTDVVKYMIEKDANANGKCSTSGILNSAISGKGSSEAKLEIVKMLVIKGADTNKRDGSGSLPLHNAVYYNELPLVKYLVEDLNAPVNDLTTDLNKETPLHIAARGTSLAIVKYLIEKGGDLNIKNKEGKTAPQVANEVGTTEINNYLERRMGRFYRNLASNLLTEDVKINYKTAHSKSIANLDEKPQLYNSNDQNRSFHKYSGFKPFHDIDVVGTLLLLDLFVRRFTGQKYVNTANQTIPDHESLAKALKISESFQDLLNSQHNISPKNIDFFQVYSTIKRAVTSGNENKLHQILCTFVNDLENIKPESFHDIMNAHIGQEKVLELRKVIPLTAESFAHFWHSITQSCITGRKFSTGLDA